MQDDERDAADPIHPLGLLAHLFCPFGRVIGIKPLHGGRGGGWDQAEAASEEGHEKDKGKYNRIGGGASSAFA